MKEILIKLPDTLIYVLDFMDECLTILKIPVKVECDRALITHALYVEYKNEHDNGIIFFCGKTQREESLNQESISVDTFIKGYTMGLDLNPAIIGKPRELNLCEILKDSVGEIFYMPMIGNVKLLQNSIKGVDSTYIQVESIHSTHHKFAIDFTGRYDLGSNLQEVEICIFPSKEQRDWSLYQPPKPKFIAQAKTLVVSQEGDALCLWIMGHYRADEKGRISPTACFILTTGEQVMSMRRGSTEVIPHRLASDTELELMQDILRKKNKYFNTELWSIVDIWTPKEGDRVWVKKENGHWKGVYFKKMSGDSYGCTQQNNTEQTLYWKTCVPFEPIPW